MPKYSIGVDYGSLSGRAVIVNMETGEELASSTYEYPHAVIYNHIPGEKQLPPGWSLQYPQDYIDVFAHTIPDVLKKTGISADDVTGVGIDFTACTILPVKKDGAPQCFLDEYKDNPHAYVKL